MIINRHIRSDFLLWTIPKDTVSRVTAVCGVRTSAKNAGVPVITDQPVVYKNGDTGWCMRCSVLAHGQIKEAMEKTDTIPSIRSIYLDALDVLSNQIHLFYAKGASA